MRKPGYTPSAAWETEPGWERVVAEPVVASPMAPREARSILSRVGRLMGHGISAQAILAHLDLLNPRHPTDQDH